MLEKYEPVTLQVQFGEREVQVHERAALHYRKRSGALLGESARERA